MVLGCKATIDTVLADITHFDDSNRFRLHLWARHTWE